VSTLKTRLSERNTKSPTLIRAHTPRMKVGLSFSKTAAAQPRPAAHASGAVATTTATTSFPLPPHCSRPLLACSTGPATQEPVRYSPLRTRSVRNRKKKVKDFFANRRCFLPLRLSRRKKLFPPQTSASRKSHQISCGPKRLRRSFQGLSHPPNCSTTAAVTMLTATGRRGKRAIRLVCGCWLFTINP